MPDADAKMPTPYWATVQCQPHRERVAERFLPQFSFEVYLPRYCFVHVMLQWRGAHLCPGVARVVRIGADEPVHVSDKVIEALRARERDGAIDLPNEKRGRKNPRVGDRVRIVSGPFVGHSGLCTQVSRQQIGVLLLMFKAQRQVQLHRDAVELA